MYRLITLLIISLVFPVSQINASSGADLELEVGYDGSNPQSTDRVEQEAPNRWRVWPFNEEGSNDAYWFRLNVRVVNNTDQLRDVELLVEWPVLERHPDYPYDYYFYGERGNWRPAYASIKGTTARLTVPCKPGITYIGFYPRYSYGQYQEFIRELESNERLELRIEGKSFHGRKIHSIRMGKAGSPKLLITARNHPYETGGSYIVEEMLRWLLSGDEDSRRLLENCEIYFLPMMNPDGVAEGCNQRTRMTGGVNMSYGADTDDPAVTTLLSLVERVKPSLWADIHSWPHEGDDGMWSTHRWVADQLLTEMPDSSFNDYIWNVSFVRERSTPENHLWQWLIRTFDSGGVSLSISWFRRNEEDLAVISRRLLAALCHAAANAPK